MLDFFVQGDEAAFEGGNYGLSAGVGIQLAQYGSYVVLNGLFADVKLDSDLFVEVTLGHVGEDLGFSWSEWRNEGLGSFSPGEVLKLFQYLMGHFRLR